VSVRCLVIENDPTDDPRRLGEWLTEAGLSLEILRAHRGEEIPADLSGYAALVLLGGEQHVYPGPEGEPGAAWFPQLEGLLQGGPGRVPTLACASGSAARGRPWGTVAVSRRGRRSARLVAKRDAAERPLSARHRCFQ
jgi:hypothetical protein